MKSFIYSTVLLLFVSTASSQTNKYIHASIIEINFFLSDYKTNTKNIKGGLGIGFTKGINNHLDWKFSLNGSYQDSILNKQFQLTEKSLLIEADVSLRARMFGSARSFQPYALGGIGVSKYKTYYELYSPVGMGIQISLFKNAYLLINSQYRLGFTKTINNHFFYGLGLAGTVANRKQLVSPKKIITPPSVNITVRDRDNDGIVDTADGCPDAAGLALFNGCPDSDNDGIPDKDDKCPSIFGLSKYFGCPVPDTDKDGINDEDDKCPSIPGLARYQGCPVPDRDSDGINDEEDKCIDVPGVKENAGCPIVSAGLKDIIDMAARNIYFETGSAKLAPVSYKALNEVVGVLKKDTMLTLTIEGHTDSIGSASVNELLSKNRALAVMEYLKSNGISIRRLNAIGFGEHQPIADNASLQGRARNRRVELKLKY